MTDAEIDALILFEVKITGGRLSMLGATDAQIAAAWLAVPEDFGIERSGLN